ncbi:hypothetical protein [Schlesneria paludicola]|uniref:hypothetical protein n=1 Tax=Schlesneria paludicola TaxID=360056 RepID=UPI00029A827B|nr:hypothetical protein [Schlesneria paludicola]
MDEKKQVSIFPLFEYLTLRTVRRHIQDLESQGYELMAVVPPSLRGSNKLTLEFHKTTPVRHTEVLFSLLWRRIRQKSTWSYAETLGTFHYIKIPEHTKLS